MDLLHDLIGERQDVVKWFVATLLVSLDMIFKAGLLQISILSHQLPHLVSSQDLYRARGDKSHVDDSFLLHEEGIEVNDTSLEETLDHKLTLVKHHVDLNDSLLEEVEIFDKLIFLLQVLSVLLLLRVESVDDVVHERHVLLQVLEVRHL